MFKYLLISVIVLFSSALYSQWDKHEIVPLSLRDSVLPIWADVDGDDLTDLVGYDEDLETLFYRKMGTSGFLSNITIKEVSLREGKFLVVDWDQDGDMDIIVELNNSFGRFIQARIFLNNGEGEFTSEDLQIEIEQFGGKLADMADLNGDGLNEVLIIHSGNHYLYTNNGTSFDYVPANVGTSNSLGRDVSLHDLNVDGNAELIDAEKDEIFIYGLVGSNLILLQEIDNTLSGLGNAPIYEDMRFHDLDGDGDIDMCRMIQKGNSGISGGVGTYTPAGGIFHEFIQGDNDRFTANRFFTTVGSGTIKATPYKLKSKNTFAYAIYDGGLKIFHFENGTFSEKEFYDEAFPVPTNEVFAAVCISDTEDERPYAFRFWNSQYELALSIPNDVPENQFAWNTCTNCALSLNYQEMHMSDLDQDGDQDILIASTRNASELVWLKNYRNGCNFDTLVPLLTDSFERVNIPLHIGTGDLDNDGDNDIVVMEQNQGYFLHILTNQGNGNFSAPNIIPVDIRYGFELYVEDIYGDGYAEIIVHEGLYSTVSQVTSSFKINIFNNTTGIDNHVLDTIPTAYSRGQLEFGDLDNDGDTDMVLYNDDPFTESVVTYTNENGSLNESQLHNEFLDMIGMDLFDYDGDGWLDILAIHDGISNNNITSLYMYPNKNGTVDFLDPIFLYEDLERSVYEAIQNEDGTKNLVGSTLNGFTSNLLLHDESGDRDTLGPRVQMDYLTGDLNGDGYDDILSGNFNGGLNFYTRGEIDCSGICVPDTEGIVRETECGGAVHFIIELSDGTFLYPYFSSGVSFDWVDGQNVEFNFIVPPITTPCMDASPVFIQCIEEGEPSSNDNVTLGSTSFRAYPNPVSGLLQVETDAAGTLLLHDLEGRLIKQIQATTNQIDLSELSEGIYFISLKTEDEVYTERIVKM